MNYFIGSDGIILIDRFILTSFSHLIVSKMANWDVRMSGVDDSGNE